MNRNIENTLVGLIPTLSGPLPEELTTLAASLVTQSRSKASNLKPEEEIARGYACAHLAAERLKQRLNLPKIEPRPPCPPRVYQALYRHLENAIPERRGRGRPKKIDIASALADEEEGGPKAPPQGGSTGGASNGVEKRRVGRPPKNRTIISRKRKAPEEEENKKENEDRIPLITPQRGRGRPRKIIGHQAPLPEPSNDDNVPLWVMPMIRHVCKTLDTPAAPPHIYAGVSSVLARWKEENQEGPGGLETENADGTGMTKLSQLENLPDAETAESQTEQQEERRPSNTAQQTSTTSTNNGGGASKLQLPPLILAIYFFVVARLMNRETGPEEYMGLRRQAMDAIGVWAASLTPDARSKFIADPASTKFMGAATGSRSTGLGSDSASNSAGADFSSADPNLHSPASVSASTSTSTTQLNSTNPTNQPSTSLDRSTIENMFNDQFFFPSGLVDRALQDMARRGWLKLEWFQNIVPGMGVAVGLKDDEDNDSNRATPQRPRRAPGRPRKAHPDAMDIDMNVDEDGDENDESEEDGDENGYEDDIGEGLGSASGGLGSMLNPRVDYLHPSRRNEYHEWKMGILARVEELELQRSATAPVL